MYIHYYLYTYMSTFLLFHPQSIHNALSDVYIHSRSIFPQKLKEAPNLHTCALTNSHIRPQARPPSLLSRCF